MKLGNGLTETREYNARLQPTKVTLGTLLTLSETITRGAQTWTDTFGYDGANRLTTASESGAGAWSQTNGFDGRGNRWVSAYSGLPAPTLETPQTSSWFLNTNRISSWTYDNAGSVTAVSGMARAFTYDAENRQKTAVVNSQTTTYTYDGDGRRVKKVAPSGTTIFVYDPFGNLAQEYGPSTDTGTKCITADHLGSTRLVTTSAGVVDRCYDFLPFGEEIGNGTAGRTSSCFGGAVYPASADKISNKFTSKERDAETGLDNFGARYMSSAQGRFTIPDWSAKPSAVPYVDLTNPQSLNLYSYLLNDPLSGVDPDGHAIDCSGDNANGAGCQAIAQWNIQHEVSANAWASSGFASVSVSYQGGAYTALQQRSTSTGTSGQDLSHFASVSYWPTGAGGFGHIGIGVDSDTTLGFSTLDPRVPWYKRLFGAPPGGTENDIQAHTKLGEVAQHFYLHIPVTPERARAMQAAMDKRTEFPGRYNLLFNNCSGFVESVLHAGGVSGVPHSEVFGPAILGGILWYENTLR